MKLNESKSNSAMGFLTVAEYPDVGLFGGYLVLNRLGRPIEFHCTAPIKPGRAQRILYGPTFEPYLFGEQIGRTLVAAAKSEPVAIFTDRPPALALRELVDVPVVLVLQAETPIADEGVPTDAVYRLDAAHPAATRLATFHLGQNRLAVASWAVEDRQTVTGRLAELAASFDFHEPFGRIREAIEEARRGG